ELSLRFIIFGGEALDVQSLKPWWLRHGDQVPRLINMYGITETTVHVTYRPLSLRDLDHPTSVIGRPIPDLQVYILDRQLQPAPVGILGEIHVGGAGVGFGCLKRSSFTGGRFVSNSLASRARGPLFKSRDLARFRSYGCID